MLAHQVPKISDIIQNPKGLDWLLRINLIWYHYFPISKMGIFSVPPLPESESYSVFLLFNTRSHYFSYTILLPKHGTLSGKSCICSPLTTKFLYHLYSMFTIYVSIISNCPMLIVC